MKLAIPRTRLRKLHLAFATAAILLPVTFLLASAGAEISRSQAVVGDVKHVIVFAIPLLAIAVGAAVASGRSLAGRSKNAVLRRKMARMKVVAPTALLVLVPAAVVLDRLASGGHFGAPFVIVQAVEFAAGATNVTMLALNLRDGLRLRALRRPRVAPRAA